MQSVVISVCLCAIVTLCTAWHTSFYTVTPSNVSCTPRHPTACGEAVLLFENSTKLEEGFGPNVCRIFRQYTIQTLSSVETEFCFGSRCRTFCANTADCTGPMEEFTRTKTECCDGFAVDPDVQDDSRHFFFRHRRANNVLREEGCTITLSDSVAVCLLDLNELQPFVTELIDDASEVIPALGNSENEDRFTIFAFSSDAAGEVNALGHIVNGTVNKNKLGFSSVFPTLRKNVFLHIVKADETYFVNGVKVEEFNACQARNGVVHLVDSVIPQSTATIADLLKNDQRFSTFLLLLDAANITMLLDVAGRKSRTVLAPTNEAFQNLTANAVDCLLRVENRKYLEMLVLIHIAHPAEYSSTLSQRSRLYTFNRRYYLFVRTDADGNILVTNDRIPLEEADISANNGVIHAIPGVIVPPEVDFDKLCPDDGADAVEGE